MEPVGVHIVVDVKAEMLDGNVNVQFINRGRHDSCYDKRVHANCIIEPVGQTGRQTFSIKLRLA